MNKQAQAVAKNSDAARILLSLWLSQRNFGIWRKIALAPTLDASVNEIRHMGQRWIGANTRIHHRFRIPKKIISTPISGVDHARQNHRPSGKPSRGSDGRPRQKNTAERRSPRLPWQRSPTSIPRISLNC
ncbi:hypothetical protein ACFS07_13805 [Undibacterium arcticum]